jgi:uncharacterized protein
VARKSKPRRSAESALRRLWALLPKLECQGLCHESCGPIFFTQLEREILEERLGGPLPPIGTEENAFTCPMLKNYRCSVYEDRPTVCRLFGAIKHALMTCPHGCEPSRHLTNQEAQAIFRKIQEISDRYQKENYNAMPDL